MASKIAQLDEVVRSIPHGSEIALGSFAITRNPIAFTNELIRQGKRDLRIHEIIGAMDGDMLVGSGCVTHYSYGGGSLDRFGRINRINAALENGTIDIHEYSGLSMTLRFLAGSLGQNYIPSKTLLGTDIIKKLMEKGAAVKLGTCPFTGEQELLFRALRPEYSVIHAPAADEKGNIIIEGPVWDEELAKSGRQLIVTVDQIVSNEYIKRHPEKVKIPNVYTTAVIPVPYGAYPTSVYMTYDYDAELLAQYAAINKQQNSFDSFIKEFILDTKDHFGFLEKCGGLRKVLAIKADPVFGYKKY
jgi:acyl CoA:acetate/3-ketoacid CoA transferase alpha subunit